MTDIQISDDAVQVVGTNRALTYRPLRVILDDGTWIAHSSRGGSLRSVWVTDLGDTFVQVLHFGSGPEGGELVLHVPAANLLAIGSLYSPETPALGSPTWQHAIEQSIALLTDDTRIVTSAGEISRDQLEAFGARLASAVKDAS